MSFTYRVGKKKDCYKIAELVDIASDGVLEYLFHGLVPGMTHVEAEAKYLENNYTVYSYKSTFVALQEKEIAGMVLSFPSSYHGLTEEMVNFFPHDRLDHLGDFFSARVGNSWYVDALGVFDNYRNSGIGYNLLVLSREKAIEEGYDSMSLIVFADNKPAIHLYKSFGFEVVRYVELGPNTFIKHENGCLLMSRIINK